MQPNTQHTARICLTLAYIENQETGARIYRRARGENTIAIDILDRIADDILMGKHGPSVETDAGRRWSVHHGYSDFWAYAKP